MPDFLTPEESKFLIEMIEHHQMGVMMSNDVLKTTDDNDIMFMALSIIYQQKNEIETMKEMLKLRSKKNNKDDSVDHSEKSDDGDYEESIEDLTEIQLSDYYDWLDGKSEEPLKDPKGGLTARGRAFYNRTQGSNLRPGVTGPADTPMKMRRKGSFLTRFFTNPSGPMKLPNGKPTRLALSAAAWGEPVPETVDDAAKLAAKGRSLLEAYDKTKK